jgi:hypothetical protein
MTWNGPSARSESSLVQATTTATAGSSPTVDSVPPVAVQTEPASGSRDVAPGLTEIR